MKIKLIKAGGIAGKKMSATADANLTAKEWDELIDLIKREPSGAGKRRDAFSYALQKLNDEESKTPIHIQQVPDKHKALFKTLFENMKAEK